MFELPARIPVRAISWGGLHHDLQPLGQAFSPTEPRGYFNDLTCKAESTQSADSSGLPVLRGPKGSFFYHPTSICQYALGCYDKWVLTSLPDAFGKFLSAADWLVRNQDTNGGWPCFRHAETQSSARIPIGIPPGWHGASGDYSGMVQGQALSVLTRAHLATHAGHYRTAAVQAFALATLSTKEGGVCCRSEGEVSLEEIPSERRNTVLNGWIFGIFGIWDFWLCTRLEAALRFFESNYASIVRRLGSFSLGWWSLYDEAGHVSKPFYHCLHAAQLSALDMVRPSSELKETIRRWNSARTPFSSVKAELAYFLQKAASIVNETPFAIRPSKRQA